MIANPDNGKKVHDYAEEMGCRFEVNPRYIRDVRIMLKRGCPEELVWELREGSISVTQVREDFEDFKSGKSADLRRISVLYLLTTDGDETVGKIGISNDVRRRIHDLELAAGPMTICGCWKFDARRDAKAVEDRILETFPAADGGRERITDWDYIEIHKMAVAGGGRWVPTTA
jgi:hypothetical protein